MYFTKSTLNIVSLYILYEIQKLTMPHFTGYLTSVGLRTQNKFQENVLIISNKHVIHVLIFKNYSNMLDHIFSIKSTTFALKIRKKNIQKSFWWIILQMLKSKNMVVLNVYNYILVRLKDDVFRRELLHLMVAQVVSRLQCNHYKDCFFNLVHSSLTMLMAAR